METLIRNKIAALSSPPQIYDWRHAKSFAQELNCLRDMVVTTVPHNPKRAAQWLEEFILCDSALIESVDDSGGYVSNVLRHVVQDWGAAWSKIAPRNINALADKVLAFYKDNGYGLRDNIIKDFATALGPEGLARIEQKLKKSLASKQDNFHSQSLRLGLTVIAELKQDIELYIEHLTDSGTYFNSLLLDKIVEQLIQWGRAQEAITWLNKYQDSKNQASHHDRLMLEANKQLRNYEIVKAMHWKLFKATLDLQDFEAVLVLSSEKEQTSYRQKAIRSALCHTDVIAAIHFLITIDAYQAATQLLHKKYKYLHGQRYSVLKNIASQLEIRQYYLEAILIYRVLAESVLDKANAKYYHYAVSYLKKATKLARHVTAWQHYPAPPAFTEQLRQEHGLKHAFWSKYAVLTL